MSLIRFDDFSADPRTGELWRDGRRVRLPRQSFQILIALTRAPGELVTREALQAELWPATSQVEWEQGLNAAVNRLRDALGDSAATPKFIETLPRRGYRFIGVPVQEPVVTAPTPPASGLSTAPPAGRLPAAGLRVAAAVATLAIIAVLVIWIAGRGAPADFAAGHLAPFTALPGEERSPALSPDGTRIAFAWNGDAGASGFDLYVKARDSEQLLRLTRHPASALGAAWSPEGTQLAFMRQATDDSGLYIVPALGGPERRIAPAAPGDAPFTQIAWSPDGKSLAYSTYEDGRHHLRVIDVATLQSHPVTTRLGCWLTGLPAFSDDGKLLAFVCTSAVGVYGVHVAPAAGGEPRLRASVMGQPQGLAWSGDSLIVANDAGDGGALWRLRAGGRLERLPFGEEGSAPATARGNIAYVRGRQAVEIWRIDLTAADPAATARRLISSTRTELTPRYSPDGRHIVFQSNRSGSAEIWMTDADGGDAVRLTQFGGPMSGAPQWCSDGKRIAFDSRADGESHLYVLDVDSRQPRKLEARGLSLPVFSRNCATLIASDGRSELVALPLATGKPALFTHQASYLAQVAGDDVVFNVVSPQFVTLSRKSLATGVESALPGMPALNYRDAWTVAERGIYYTSADEEGVFLAFYEFASAQSTRLARLPAAPAPGGGLGLEVSRDGHWALYSRGAEAQSDIMLVTPR